jgi:hypothetical protein
LENAKGALGRLFLRFLYGFGISSFCLLVIFPNLLSEGWEYRRENKEEDRSNAPVLVEMEPAEVLSVIA